MANVSTKVLVTGAFGLLGMGLQGLLRAQGWQVLTHGVQSAADFQADLRDKEATRAMLQECQPDAIINLAALTNVDLCETAPQEAYLLNVAAVGHLAAWIRESGKDCFLLHISSDQVYEAVAGQNEEQQAVQGPFHEGQVNIKNTYAFSKAASELLAVQVQGAALRTNFYGKSARPGRSSFTDWLWQALHSGQQITLFDDVLFSPLWMPSLQQVIVQVLQQRLSGIYNLGSKQGMSKADFGFAFAAACGMQAQAAQIFIRTSSSQAQQLKAYRPRDMRMDCRLLEQRLGVQLPLLADEILLCGRQYREQ